MQKPRSQHGAGAMASGGVKSRSPQPTTSAAAHITALALYRRTEGNRGEAAKDARSKERSERYSQ